MQIYTTTRWTDNKNTDLKEIESLLLDRHPDERSDVSASYINWSIDKAFPENKKVHLNGRDIEYNFYKFSVDFVPGGMLEDDDMIMHRTGFIIPYLSAGKIRYIIDRNSDAQTLLRKMLRYAGKGEAVRTPVRVFGDLFVWLISKVYKGENIIESNSDTLADISIDAVRGFKGNTEDLRTKVSASGENEILPIIIQNYQIAVEATQWGQGKCVDFLQQVANDLSEKVKVRIQDLTSRPEQLRIPIETEGDSISTE